MTRLRNIAVIAAGSAILALGMVGCMPEQPDPISPKAMMETSGDNLLAWSSPSAGRLTILDKNTDKIIYASNVNSGQAVKIDVPANRVTMDGQIVAETVLHGGDQYRIYFEPTTTIEKTSTVETNSVETVHEK
jgi:hypothetical protein